MKTAAFISIACLMFAGCNNSQQEKQIKYLTERDSTLLEQTQQRDSTIMSYIHSLNDIQDNLNAIKSKEKILSMPKEVGNNETTGGSIVTDIKTLDALIVKNHKEIYALEKKLKSQSKQDQELKRMIENLSKDLNDKDVEIANLEMKLSKANDSIKMIVSQFNDSMMVISRQKMEITAMKTAINTIYYAVGTYKELKQKGVVDKQGGVAGIGSVPKLKQDFNTSYFTSALMPELRTIPLYSKFTKLITNHPGNSYKITTDGKVDSFVITDPASFWSESKYLVIIVNQQTGTKKGEVSTLSPPPPAGM